MSYSVTFLPNSTTVYFTPNIDKVLSSPQSIKNWVSCWTTFLYHFNFLEFSGYLCEHKSTEAQILPVSARVVLQIETDAKQVIMGHGPWETKTISRSGSSFPVIWTQRSSGITKNNSNLSSTSDLTI